MTSEREAVSTRTAKPMDEERARQILSSSIRPDDNLDNLGHYTFWVKGSRTITLDDDFDDEELEAIVWWMRNKSV